MLVRAVENAQDEGDTSAESISAQFGKLSGTEPSEDWLTQRLWEAETAGLIKMKITSIDDHPKVNWVSAVSEPTSKNTLFRLLRI